jgi:replicative superfamily II helicase
MIAGMCIIRAIYGHENENGVDRKRDVKCIYIAPMKSLVGEIFGGMQSCLSPCGIQVCFKEI